MKFFGVIVALMAVGTVDGFASIQASGRNSVMTQHMTIVDGAQALSEYMAKSHEDKLRAIQDVEMKKNAEIEALKKEIESLKSNKGSTASSSAITPAVEGSREEIAAKLIAYQQFMAKYIVEAQEQKLQAVKAAEAAVAKKYEENLLALGAAPAARAPAASIAADTTTSKETNLYKERNAKVSAAAAAGKTRWGQGEVERVTSGSKIVNVGAAAIQPVAKAAPMNVATAAKVNGAAAVNGAAVNGAAVPATVPPEVEAADHGLRADGGVGGLTLAERVAMGAAANGAVAPAATSAAATPVLSKNKSLYQARNAKVAAAGNKSRWGDMEVQRAIKLASEAPAIMATPEIEAADHGLRADGGVGGPTLAERVNLGAQLLGR